MIKTASDGTRSYHGMAAHEAQIAVDAMCSGIHQHYVVSRPEPRGLYAEQVFRSWSLEACLAHCAENGWTPVQMF